MWSLLRLFLRFFFKVFFYIWKSGALKSFLIKENTDTGFILYFRKLFPGYFMRPIFQDISVFGDVFPERSLKLICFCLYNDNILWATYQGFPYWGDGRGVPPLTAKNLLISPHLEKFLPSRLPLPLPPPNFYSLLTKSQFPPTK